MIKKTHKIIKSTNISLLFRSFVNAYIYIYILYLDLIPKSIVKWTLTMDFDNGQWTLTMDLGM